MRVMMLGPWPIERQRHGGQIRAHQVRSAYQDRGHETRFIGIYDPNNTEPADSGPWDLRIDERVMQYIADSGEHWEISLWNAFAAVPELLEHFARVVREFDPHVVQLEEPYLWPVVKALRRRGLLRNALVVHSSYNFETDYRRELAEISGSFNEAALHVVAQQEIELAAECDLIVTVSDADCASFTKIGANAVVVARNGCRPIEADPDAAMSVRNYFGGQPYALFVSSAHPPNAQGLLDFAGVPLVELMGRLVICGSVCNLLAPRAKEFPLIRHARMLGMLDVPLLDAMLTEASVILLPKTRGGGSNLKTSEALLAHRPVVATTHAFVGFEPWATVDGVTVANEPVAFWRAALRHLQQTSRVDTGAWTEQRLGLLWSACLAPMVDAVESLVSAPRARRP